MVDIKKVIKLANQYDREHDEEVDYEKNRAQLREYVEKYGNDITSVATGLSKSTIAHHMRKNKRVTMISNKSLDRAEWVFSKL